MIQGDPAESDTHGDMAKVHGPRIKAARGYAGISTAELASRVGVSESTAKRWEAGDPGLTAGYRVAIAHACRVPLDFIERGWEYPDRDEIHDRLRGLEAAVERVERALSPERLLPGVQGLLEALEADRPAGQRRTSRTGK